MGTFWQFEGSGDEEVGYAHTTIVLLIVVCEVSVFFSPETRSTFHFGFCFFFLAVIVFFIYFF